MWHLNVKMLFSRKFENFNYKTTEWTIGRKWSYNLELWWLFSHFCLIQFDGFAWRCCQGRPLRGSSWGRPVSVYNCACGTAAHILTLVLSRCLFLTAWRTPWTAWDACEQNRFSYCVWAWFWKDDCGVSDRLTHGLSIAPRCLGVPEPRLATRRQGLSWGRSWGPILPSVSRLKFRKILSLCWLALITAASIKNNDCNYSG